MTKAKAVLFTLLANGKVYTDVFTEDDYADPQLECERTLAAVGGDFPGAIHSIGLNDRARELMKNRRMRNMGFPEDEYPKVLSSYPLGEGQTPKEGKS